MLLITDTDRRAGSPFLPQLTLVINSLCAYPLYNPPSQGNHSAHIGHVSSRNQFVSRHPWLTALVALAAVQIASSGTLKGQTLAAFADVLQFTIMVAMIVGTLINIRPSRGSARIFWILMTISALMWTGDYATWVYYEVIRRVHMPVPQPGDTLLILHVIPIMMALAMLPHRVLKSGGSISSNLGFPLIACWWTYLYFQFVFVWQYLSFDAGSFHQNFNLLYHAELATSIVALFYLAQQSRDAWHEIYNHYLIAFLIYAPSSAIINILIQQDLYSSGGLWDLPLTVSIAYLAWIGFRAHKLQPEPERSNSDLQPRLAIPEWAATVAATSIPAIALFSFERLHDPPGVRHFRIALSFASMLVIGILIFTRQQFLNRRLAVLLTDSQRAYDNLERLQSQVMQTEKLASIGRLVSGAAHELNNPLTAILGYSELISSDQEVPAAPRGFAEKIAQQARRTKNLVSNLLSFARQTPPQKRLTDLNSLVNNACQLRLASMPTKLSLVRDLQSDLPLVLGDDNHLLQVFLHVLN
ncbi:MAG TPA: histidine kinase dimerization/phospho-acceptor domain-containing protein, partial [Terriglobales bacterium]|nr:histidine kinase dimerization/phospho-acceptor domain-containing protein [Terriglobales bacterium]